MNKKHVIIDFDDVLVDTAPAFFDFLNHRFQKNFSRDLAGKKGFFDLFNLSIDEALDLFNPFCFSKFHDQINPVDYSADVLIYLHEKSFPIIATSRRNEVAKPTYEIGRKLFSEYLPPIYFEVENKLKFARDLGSEAVIDDSYSNIRGESGGVKQILFNRDWNSHVDCESEGIYRLNNWKEAGALI